MLPTSRNDLLIKPVDLEEWQVEALQAVRSDGNWKTIVRQKMETVIPGITAESQELGFTTRRPLELD